MNNSKYKVYDNEMAKWLKCQGCKITNIDLEKGYIEFAVSKRFKQATLYYKENIDK